MYTRWKTYSIQIDHGNDPQGVNTTRVGIFFNDPMDCSTGPMDRPMYAPRNTCPIQLERSYFLRHSLDHHTTEHAQWQEDGSNPVFSSLYYKQFNMIYTHVINNLGIKNITILS